MVRALHDEQIALFGGSPGDLHGNALEAALARPVNTFAYDDAADLATFAALYLVGLVNAHAFVDGNKRVGLAAMLVFLRLNGHAVHVAPAQLYRFVLDVATGQVREKESAEWIRAHIG
jgi:death-on-curing protein